VYEIIGETVIGGDVSAVWAAATDVAGWPAWDPHEEAARLDGPFAAGTTGWSKPNGGPAATWTLTEVVEQRRWASECALPGGKLSGVSEYEPLGDGRVRCRKTIRVTGPLVPLFRLHFGRGIRRDMDRTWAALEREAARRGERAGA
jgi:polyketide cyclase/dehydrase/lipid transport protein